MPRLAFAGAFREPLSGPVWNDCLAVIEWNCTQPDRWISGQFGRFESRCTAHRSSIVGQSEFQLRRNCRGYRPAWYGCHCCPRMGAKTQRAFVTKLYAGLLEGLSARNISKELIPAVEGG